MVLVDSDCPANKFQYNQIKVMQPRQAHNKNTQYSPSKFTVLHYPYLKQLRQSTTSAGKRVVHANEGRKINMVAYQINIKKSKLLANLQIYKWRLHTEFPIIKTYSMKQKIDGSQGSTVQMEVLCENCPVILRNIFNMLLRQAVYLLKQALVGFQRLYDRFGGFDVTDSMVAINDKGYCKVWVNENFGSNFYVKKDMSQSKMVIQIISLFEDHCQQSKSIKRLFTSLKSCSSFLTALKSIQIFIKQEKVIVPNKFNNSTSPQKQNEKLKTPNLSTKPSTLSQSPLKITRFSIKQQKLTGCKQQIRQQLGFSFKIKDRISLSPQGARKIKTEHTSDYDSLLKVSNGDTAHTGNKNKSSNTQIGQSSNSKQSEPNSLSPKKRSNWVQQSSYLMQQEDLLKANSQPQRKQLTKSQAQPQAFNYGKQTKVQQQCNRKYSYKLSKQKKFHSDSKLPYFDRKIKNQNYLSQFSNLLNDQKQHKDHSSIVEVDEQKFLQDHSGVIIKNNGWVPSLKGLVDLPNQLEQSFHQGVQERAEKREAKLQKLDRIIKKELQTSFLPEQLNNLF